MAATIATTAGRSTPMAHQTPEGRRQYSVGAVVSALLDRTFRDQSVALITGPTYKIMFEISDQISHVVKHDPQGFFVPLDAPMWALGMHSTATMDAAGIPLAADAYPMTLVDVLRSKSVLGRLGMEMPIVLDESWPYPLPSNRASIRTPWRDTAFVDFANDHPTLGDPIAAARKNCTPKTVVAEFQFTRKTAVDQEATERVAIKRLIEAMASEVDRVGLVGGAQNAEPLGVLADDTVPVYEIGANGGPPTWAIVCEMERALGGVRADTDPIGWISSSAGRSKLRQTYRNTNGPEIWSDRDTIAGRKAMATDNVPTDLTKGSGADLTALILGRWDELVMPLFWAVDLFIDPYTSDLSGTINMTATFYADIARYDNSYFLACKDMSVS